MKRVRKILPAFCYVRSVSAPAVCALFETFLPHLLIL